MIPVCILAIEDDSDREFMERLYFQYHRLMYHEIFKITSNPDATEDILQTALVKLIDKIQKLRTLDRNRLVNYIISTVKNTAFNFLRNQSRKPSLSFDDCMDCPDWEQDKGVVEDRIVYEEEIERLQQVWSRLDERSRYLLEGRYILDRTNEELAQELNVKPASVRMALTRARKAAFELISEDLV